MCEIQMKKAQNLIEYILIFSLIGVVGYFITSNIDFGKIKNYIFMRPGSQDAGGGYSIKIEAMTK